MSGEIDKVFIDLNTNLKKFKEEFKMELLSRVERRTPVRSGDLQNGWGATNTKTGFEVWNTMDYAAYVEYGTPLQRPQGMLRASVEESEQIAEIAAKRAGLKK